MVLRWSIALVFILLSTGICAKPFWHLYFCLPYDNDLSQHAEFITSEIADHIASDRVEVTLLLQLPKANIQFRHSTSDTTIFHDSGFKRFADGMALEAFIKWSDQRIPDKKRKAFFMLGHGGGVDRMALEVSSDSTWMKTSVFASILSDHGKEHGIFDVLFLQQCVKATVSEYYELEHAAKWIAASPLPIGAPNFYYAAVLNQLSRGRLRNPVDLIHACIAEDRLDMSEIWSVVKAERFAHWLRYLNEHPPSREYSSKLQDEHLDFEPKAFGTLGTIQYVGETYWDLKAWLEMLKRHDYFNGTEYGKIKSGYLRAVETVDRNLRQSSGWRRSGEAFPYIGLCGVSMQFNQQSPNTLRFYTECANLVPFLQDLERWPD